MKPSTERRSERPADRILALLRREPCPGDVIAARLGISRGTVLTALVRLKQAGLVEEACTTYSPLSGLLVPFYAAKTKEVMRRGEEEGEEEGEEAGQEHHVGPDEGSPCRGKEAGRGELFDMPIPCIPHWRR